MRVACVTVLIANCAFAQNSLSLREAVARALSLHPAISASSARITASQGLQTQAGLRPNPRAFFQTENLRPYGTPGFNFAQQADTFAYLSQVVETGGKRGRRVEAAGANVRRAQLERALIESNVSSRVRTAYWSAAVARKLHELLAENDKNFRHIVEYHENRVREGAMAEADLLRVRLEGERLAIGTNTAGLEADRARIQLFREMAATEFPDVTLSEPLDPREDVVDVDISRALSQRAEIKIARHAVDQARANLELQRALAKPDLDFIGGYKRSAGFHTLLGGVQFNLPLSDRNQGNVAAAISEVRAAESNMAATEALVRAEVEAARREFAIRRNQVLKSVPPLRDQAAESAKIALAAYQEGGADLMRLLDAERSRIDVQLLLLRSLSDYHHSRVALETALGNPPESF